MYAVTTWSSTRVRRHNVTVVGVRIQNVVVSRGGKKHKVVTVSRKGSLARDRVLIHSCSGLALEFLHCLNQNTGWPRDTGM